MISLLCNNGGHCLSLSDLGMTRAEVQYMVQAKLIAFRYSQTMELRHLRYFVAVAEERHFTRAAARLGIKQPPLSLQIRRLEQEIGAPLFHRLTRGVELTESGALLLEDARRILDQVERTLAGVQSRARGETGHIRVGFAGSTYFHPI